MKLGSVIHIIFLLLLLLSVIGDIRTGRISNRLIAAGLGLGLLYRICRDGPSGIFSFFAHTAIPVILFFILFRMHVLGAGDIKLFSIISSFCTYRQLFYSIAAAFAVGAVFGMIKSGSMIRLCVRVRCFGYYVREILQRREIFPYPYLFDAAADTIPFSAAIVCGYLISWTILC